MVNILLPFMGSSPFFKNSFFPKPLIEINGKTMLELVIEDFADLSDKNFIFIFSEENCIKFHLDESAKILIPDGKIIRLKNKTAGALCTCLMAVDFIENDTPLIIANSDQIIDIDYKKVISYFESVGTETGVITFPNIHPRWSYARIKEQEIIEVAEKRPLSKNAIAGFYYYKRGRDFIAAAKAALKKQDHLDNVYYISASINQMILLGKKANYYEIKKEQYHSFYSMEKIKEYEEKLK